MRPERPRDILLVEDNPDDAELTSVGLERHNLANRVVIASDGVEALELLTGGHATPFAFVNARPEAPERGVTAVLERAPR